MGSSVNSSGTMNMVIWRYNSDGTLDTTFGNNGSVISNGLADFGFSMTIDSNQKILVTGLGFYSSDAISMVIWRYNSNGTLDTTFGNNGKVVSNVADGGSATGGSVDMGASMAIDSNQKILVTGLSADSSDNYGMVIWRYNSNGTLDTTFGTNGIVVADGGSVDIGHSITIDSNQKILVTGIGLNSTSYKDMVIWRYNNNGTLDTTFGTNGIVVNSNAAGGDSTGGSITTDSSGRILVTGHGKNFAGGRDTLVWRYNSDGTLSSMSDLRSGAHGMNVDGGSSITIDSNGRILVTGATDLMGNANMTIWRLLP
ncbi:hypothetical protein MBAV_000186 [Candidatus Magnetobacterium bavaricum]|uniref:Uncharacterized protein n=1 Tax=Candidatus Magnetobacterium bavaricum TaxID=29290 RepID=A0A0F3H0J8_9BACT|nr:hypothetical protein MBAV_000186 [Candidatus Magnetobacterium bavaricum]